MFLFQSDSDLPNILLGMTLLIIAFISLVHSPESLAVSPLGRLKDLLLGFVFRCTGVGVGVGGPAARGDHPPVAMELPPVRGAGTQTIPNANANANAVQDTGLTSSPLPSVICDTPAIISCDRIITQIMPTDHTPIPLQRAISIITAHIAVTRLQRSRFELVVEDSHINSVVDAFALALINPNPSTQYALGHDGQRASLNHLQTHIQQLNININLNLPEKTITTAFSSALALKSRVLSVLIRSPTQGALRGFHHISMEPTQRTFVGFERLGQAARAWLRTRLGVGMGRRPSPVHHDHAYDLEGGVLDATDEEVDNWVEEMARLVVQGVRRMCELIPPEESSDRVRVCEGFSAADDDGCKIKLKD